MRQLITYDYVEGYCPVHNEILKIKVCYKEFRARGAPLQRKAFDFKCDDSIECNSQCNRCPIFYSPATQAP